MALFLPVAQAAYTETGFENSWNKLDKAVSEIYGLNRSYTWGPQVLGSETLTQEFYNGVSRHVQYFDKARMEVSNPALSPADPYYVTTGLLVKELVTGKRQDGDNQFTELSPSELQVVGDPNDNGANTKAPTYATFRNIITSAGTENGKDATSGAIVTASIDRAGTITTIAPPEQRLISGYDSTTRHNIADVFVDFGQQSGPLWNGSAYTNGAVFSPNTTYLLGRPVTEPYWTRATVGGIEKDVLLQLFERRVLTYTPSNPAGSRVEMGNVGQHYFKWRYVVNAGVPAPKHNPIKTSPIVTYSWGGNGILQGQDFHSNILNRDMSYRIFLPPGYNDNPSRHYPTVFMLHGWSGTYQEWMDYGLLNGTQDLVNRQEIQPYIIVLPLGDMDYWLNHANGGPRWADYLTYEVVDLVDSQYRTIPDKAYRAIGGLSMGGHGALQIAFNYPELFTIVGADSPTLRPREIAWDYFGDAAYYATIDPISLAKVKDLSQYKIWIDIGLDDTLWRPRANELHQVLLSRGKAHSFTEYPGGHGYDVWATHVQDYIRFYAGAFPPLR
jgi:S-formylglutathione hydrolase FrmB